jgi:hypothetical protein
MSAEAEKNQIIVASWEIPQSLEITDVTDKNQQLVDKNNKFVCLASCQQSIYFCHTKRTIVIKDNWQPSNLTS